MRPNYVDDPVSGAALLGAVDAVPELLDGCEPRPEQRGRVVDCRDRLRQDPLDHDALRQLCVLAAPKGFLGDDALCARPDSGVTQLEVDHARDELGARIHRRIRARPVRWEAP